MRGHPDPDRHGHLRRKTLKILLHICCAPCAIYPLKDLSAKGAQVKGFFYRHNIHPYRECLKREEALRSYAAEQNLNVIYQDGYDLEGFIRQAAFRESERCRYCYHDRLLSTARLAKEGRFDRFSSTLLYSRYQRHDLIRSLGESIAETVGIPFYYADFRLGWQEGVETSRRLGMYRQSYCGCIYSEKERYFKPRPAT